MRACEDKRERKALFIAANKNCDMVRLLLEHGADAKLAPKVFPNELFEVLSYGVNMYFFHLSEQLIDNVAMDVGQTMVATLIFKR